jgi:hypothetical protein
MYTTVIGIKRMIVGSDAANEWNLIMATAILAMLPPALVVLLMQKWFVKGLVETEKYWLNCRFGTYARTTATWRSSTASAWTSPTVSSW